MASASLLVVSFWTSKGPYFGRKADMEKSRWIEKQMQIIGLLMRAEAVVATPKCCLTGGLLNAASYNWRAEFSGMDSSEARWLELEA